MKKTTFASIAVITAFLMANLTSESMAGTQPSPFHQISAINMHIKVLGKRVDERLASPPDPRMPGEAKKAVVAVHNIGFDLLGLDNSLYLITDEIRFPEGDLGPNWSFDSASELKRNIKKIINSVDTFLSFPPGPVAPEFLGAVGNLRAQAVIMLKNVNRTIRELKELLDFIDDFMCSDDIDCGCTGVATPCSSFNTETDCRGQDGCNWILNDARVGTCIGTAKPCDAINPSECTLQDGCANISCTNGLCVRTPDCYVNSDCPEGSQCIFGFCSPEDLPPPVPGSCSVDGDCPEGSYCLFSVCVPDNAPIPSFCGNDSDCPPALNCHFGICLPF